MLREAGDRIRDQLGTGAAVLGAVMNEKVNFLAVVTDDLISGGVLRADELVREVAKIAGGSGGGKPHQALAGGKQVDKLDEALERGRQLLRERLAGTVPQS
jgi:alanyl-tRNA synthetase